jgi:hypothetical protein
MTNTMLLGLLIGIAALAIGTYTIGRMSSD